MGQASPNGVTPSQKTKPIVVIEYTRMFTRGLPHELKLFTSAKLLIHYTLLRLPSGICCRCDRRRLELLAPRLDDIRLCRRQGDVHFRPRLHAIRRLGDVLLTHTFGHIRTMNIHYPLHGDLLGQQPCVWQQALPERLDVLRATAIGIPTVDGGEV